MTRNTTTRRRRPLCCQETLHLSLADFNAPPPSPSSAPAGALPPPSRGGGVPTPLSLPSLASPVPPLPPPEVAVPPGQLTPPSFLLVKKDVFLDAKDDLKRAAPPPNNLFGGGGVDDREKKHVRARGSGEARPGHRQKTSEIPWLNGWKDTPTKSVFCLHRVLFASTALTNEKTPVSLVVRVDTPPRCAC